MSFDIEPDAPIHGECAAEIHRLELDNNQLREHLKERLASAETKLAELEEIYVFHAICAVLIVIAISLFGLAAIGVIFK